MTPGARLPAAVSAPNTVLDRKSSSSQLRNRESGWASERSASSRVSRLTSSRSVWGNQYMSAWWLPATISSKEPRATSHDIGCSSASSRKSGSTAKVTRVRIPRAPRPTRAISRTSALCSGEASRTSPVPVTSCSPAIWADRPAATPPVPWVPVDVAPASVCSAMSPMLCSERPSRSSSALSTLSWVPAHAVTVIASRSTATRPAIPCGRSIASSGAEIAVKLWPLPTIFTVPPTRRAPVTASTTSSTEVGVITVRGSADSRPAQFCHCTGAA